MYGDLTVRASAEFIPDPRKLIADIEVLAMTLPKSPETLAALKAARNLVVQATKTEYMQTNVDYDILDKHSDYMDFINDKLRTSLGERLIRVVGPIVTTTREE